MPPAHPQCFRSRLARVRAVCIFVGAPTPEILVSRLLVTLLVALASAATAQAQAGATVLGVVRDSLARTPLVGATVQLVSADGASHFAASAVADSLGRFAIQGVPRGHYTLGFFHPLLDSLGVASPLRALHVEDASRTVRIGLATPSARALRTAICGAQAEPDSIGVVVGVVRDARNGAPVAGASVTGEWLEMSFRRDGVARRVPRHTATTGENGWFAICSAPSGGTMWVVAGHGADSTDRIEVQVPRSGFLRRELHVGASRSVTTTDTARLDSAAVAPRRVRLGDVRLAGVVLAAASGRPVSGARVGIPDGPQGRTNERGEWALADAPAGTRTLEVRAVGYYPERRAVDVVEGAPAVRTSLSTLKAVLDTVRITARRVYDRDRSGFQRRSRAGLGHFLDEEDIARRAPLVTSDLFRMMPGVRFLSDGFETRLMLRSGFGDCAPAIYLDGLPLFGVTASDVDGWVSPREVRGIEVHAGPGVPPEFQQGLSGCGAIVIWTR